MSEVVIGLREAIKALENLGTSFLNEDMKEAVQRGLVVIGKEVISRTPHNTGKLASSLQAEATVHSSGLIGGAYEAKGWVGFTGRMGALAMWLEYGHRVVSGGREIGRAKPRPFMRPALDASAMEVFEVVAASMTAGLARGGAPITNVLGFEAHIETDE